MSKKKYGVSMQHYNKKAPLVVYEYIPVAPQVPNYCLAQLWCST